VVKLPPDYDEISSRSAMAAELLSPMLVRASELAASPEPFFFPEYTDHSTRHIEDVLGAALDLIHRDSANTVSDNDYCVLALATILHDIGLHLRAEGFLALLQSDPGRRVRFDHTQPGWAQLWEDFLSEAARFDERRLVELFNSVDPVRRPPTNVLDWSLRDRLLIGEFLRRYHARLSHEIAFYGFPLGRGEYRQLLAGAPAEIRDMVGLIARSHGIAVRDTLPYIKQFFDLRDYNGIHIVYIMILLRIADYLQIQPTRAPANMRDVRRIQSPFSNREWIAHSAIKNISVADLDPEAVNILAEPPNVRTYLRIRDWLSGIQFELDLSWAILGETYGRFSSSEPKNDLANLKLRVRRVKSNVDDLTSFALTIPYLPQRVTFTSAGSDLLKLLVGPLYNYNAFVGIRELFQNAADAVRELDDILSHEPDLSISLGPDLSREGVVINLELAKNKITKIEICDSGVGMHAGIIINYFLTAGASFRNSRVWRELHEEKDHSRVARGGRFGIGAIAAFLLGQKIRVHTRHYTSPADQSIYFEADISSTAIELLKKPKSSIGTSISVELATPMDTLNFKRWLEENIYSSDVPISVPNFPAVDDKNIDLKMIPRTLTFNTPILFGWSDEAISVGASFMRSDLVVNAIKIESLRSSRQPAPAGLDLDFGYFSLTAPGIIVWDRDSVFPLNLQRTEANFVKFASKEKLIFVIVAELLAKLAAYKDELVDCLFAADLDARFPSVAGEAIGSPFAHFRTGLYYEKRIRPLALTKDGIVLANPVAFSANGINDAIVIASPEIRSASPLLDVIGRGTALCHWETQRNWDDTASKYTAVLKAKHLQLEGISAKVTSFLIADQVVKRFMSFKQPPSELSNLQQIEDFGGELYAPGNEHNETLFEIASILREQKIRLSAVFHMKDIKRPWWYQAQDQKQARFLDVARELLGSQAVRIAMDVVGDSRLESTKYFRTRVAAYVNAPLKQPKRTRE
jgi:hypothetical protein